MANLQDDEDFGAAQQRIRPDSPVADPSVQNAVQSLEQSDAVQKNTARPEGDVEDQPEKEDDDQKEQQAAIQQKDPAKVQIPLGPQQAPAPLYFNAVNVKNVETPQNLQHMNQILGNAAVRENAQDDEAFDPAQQQFRLDFRDANAPVEDYARQMPEEPEDVRNFEDLHRVLQQFEKKKEACEEEEKRKLVKGRKNAIMKLRKRKAAYRRKKKRSNWKDKTVKPAVIEAK